MSLRRMKIFPTWKSGRPFASTEPLDRCTRDCLCGTLEPESVKFTGQMDPQSSTHFRTRDGLHHTVRDVSISQRNHLGVDRERERETRTLTLRCRHVKHPLRVLRCFTCSPGAGRRLTRAFGSWEASMGPDASGYWPIYGCCICGSG